VLLLDEIDKGLDGLAPWISGWLTDLLDALDDSKRTVVFATSEFGQKAFAANLSDRQRVYGRIIEAMDFQHVDGENWRLRDEGARPWWIQD
jgi:ABC-type branched-subunit amino acid transport system ATPase component